MLSKNFRKLLLNHSYICSKLLSDYRKQLENRSGCYEREKFAETSSFSVIKLINLVPPRNEGGILLEPLEVGMFIGLGEDPRVSLKRVEDLGFTNAQVLAPPEEFFREPRRKELIDAVRKSRVKITAMFAHFRGESYTDLPTIRRTVGLVPSQYREERTKRALEISDLAKELGIKRVAAHIGFIPEDPKDPNYRPLVEAVRKIADKCAENGQEFCLETGQETAPTLLRFIKDVNRDNLKVNFDPANMILYGSGDPIEALEMLGKYVVGVHAKDGKWPIREGTLGTEYPLGQGDVGIERLIKKLKEIGYTGTLTIEREITGEQQIRDTLAAKKLLERLR